MSKVGPKASEGMAETDEDEGRMNCERVRALLPGYLDGEGSVTERLAIGAHLESCAACASESAAQQSLLRLLAETPRRTLAPEWDAALKTRLGSLDERRQPPRLPVLGRPSWRLLLAPAAVAAALLSLWRPAPETARPTPASDRAYVSRLVGQHLAGARARDLPEQEAVEVALRATSVGSLIE